MPRCTARLARLARPFILASSFAPLLGGPGRASAAELSEGAGHAPIGRLQATVGLGVAVGLSARRIGDPAVPSDSFGVLAGTSAYGAVYGRLAGYAERHAPGARAVMMVLPELMLDLEVGGTVARRDARAAEQGLALRGGPAVGPTGVTNIGVGWASHGVAGV